MKRNAIAASLCAEMAQLLKAKQLKNPSSSQSFNFITLFQKLEKFGEAAEFFQQAAEIQQTESPLNAIVSLEDAVQCHVQLRDYKAGCAALIWITKLAGEMLSVQNEGINQFFCFSDSPNFQFVFKANWKSSHPDGNYSTFANSLIGARVSLILLMILRGDFQQARQFVLNLTDDAATMSLSQSQISEQTISLIESFVVSI